MISMEEQLNTLGVKSIKPNGKAPKGTKSGPEFECTLDAHAIFVLSSCRLPTIR